MRGGACGGRTSEGEGKREDEGVVVQDLSFVPKVCTRSRFRLPGGEVAFSKVWRVSEVLVGGGLAGE